MLGIVVPVYNVEQYLSKCIESIINQTYKNWRLVLVDDGSTDASLDICKRYAQLDDRIEVIEQENAGPLKARYNGINKINCEYVTFVDADDWLDLEVYEKMSHYMEKNVDVITFGVRSYFDDTNIIMRPNSIGSGLYMNNELVEKVYPFMLWDAQRHVCGLDAACWNKIAKYDLYKDSIEQAKEINFQYGEDVAIVYNMISKATSLYVSDECLYYHRQREVGLLAKYVTDDAFLDNLYLLYKHLCKTLPDSNIYRKQIEYFYLHALEVRLRKYGDKRTRKNFIFPFDKVSKEDRIVLYGAGEVGQTFYKQITDIQYCELVLWVDKNYQAYKQYCVKPIEEIKNQSFDWIIIAIKDENLSLKVKNNLVELGIDPQKIIWSVNIGE